MWMSREGCCNVSLDIKDHSSLKKVGGIDDSGAAPCANTVLSDWSVIKAHIETRQVFSSPARRLLMEEEVG